MLPAPSSFCLLPAHICVSSTTQFNGCRTRLHAVSRRAALKRTRAVMNLIQRCCANRSAPHQQPSDTRAPSPPISDGGGGYSHAHQRDRRHHSQRRRLPENKVLDGQDGWCDGDFGDLTHSRTCCQDLPSTLHSISDLIHRTLTVTFPVGGSLST